MQRSHRTAVRITIVSALLTLSACGADSGAEGTDPADPTDAATPDAAASRTSDAGPTGSKSPSRTTTTPTTTPTSAPDAAVPEVLDFSATTVSGEAFEGASVAGRPVLLWFWAPWCPTCRGQIPQVEGLAADYGDDLTVLGVGSLDSADAIAEFAEDVDEFTQLEDEDGDLYRRFGIVEQSSFVLLDSDGEVAFSTGYGGADDLADEVAAVVG